MGRGRKKGMKKNLQALFHKVKVILLFAYKDEFIDFHIFPLAASNIL